MAISKVGLGWSAGERDYASLNLWLSAILNSGVYEYAWCKGSCTTSTLNITSGLTAGALIFGEVEYNGANESALAFANHRVNNAVDNVVIQDLQISQSNNFTITTTANGSGALFRRCRIKHLGSHGATYGAIQLINNGAAEKSVISTVGARVTVHSFNNPLTLSNNVIFGATGYAVGPIFSEFQTVSNCFSLNNAGEDYAKASGADTTTNSASEDATGNITGYTSAEFVDFAGGDYRIKSTSDLVGLNIGAFFETVADTGNAVEALATANITISAEKIGQACAGLNTTAAAALTAHKIAKAPLAVSANADAGVTANKIGQSLLPVSATSIANVTASKIGFGTASLNGTADINLISGSNIIVEATINFNAAASIALSGHKCAASSVAFLSAANIQLSASKTGNTTVNLTAGSLASLAASKIGSSAAALQCAVVQSLLSNKTAYSSFIVPVSISITLSGLSAATKPVARAVFISTRSQQKSLLTTSSKKRHSITNHSRQRYNLQSGGVNV